MTQQHYVEDCQAMFARYGFTFCPLSAQDLAVCFEAKASLDDLYSIGCDVAAGYSLAQAMEVVL